jgi:hypothetical protein
MPRGHGGGIRGVHPGSARRGAPAARPPVSAPGRPDPPHSGDRLVRGGKGADHDQGGAGAGEAGDADMTHASTPERFSIPSRLAPASPKGPAGSDQPCTGHGFFVTPFSEVLRLITLSRAPGHQSAGTMAEGRSVTHARIAGGMVWRRGAVRGLPFHAATGIGGPLWTGRRALGRRCTRPRRRGP